MDKILIVEDNMELLEGLCRSLQGEGFAVFAAGTGICQLQGLQWQRWRIILKSK